MVKIVKCFVTLDIMTSFKLYTDINSDFSLFYVKQYVIEKN